MCVFKKIPLATLRFNLKRLLAALKLSYAHVRNTKTPFNSKKLNYMTELISAVVN